MTTSRNSDDKKRMFPFSRRLFLVLFLGLSTLLFSLSSHLASAQQFDYGSVRLLLTGEKSGALLFDLNNPWKTSWRKNTINVFPTELRWQDEGDNSATSFASSFLWPFPKTFDLFGVRGYGYAGRTALPFTTREPVKLGARAEVQFAACAQVCLPIQTTLTAERPTAQEGLFIAAALEQVPEQMLPKEVETQTRLQLTYLPVDSPDRTLASQAGDEVLQGEQSVLLQGRFSSEHKLLNPRLIVERANKPQGGLFAVTSLKSKSKNKSKDKDSGNLRFKAEGRLPLEAGETSIRVSLVADNLRPLSLLATPELARSPFASSSTSSATSSAQTTNALLGLLTLAFLGGLVLNAMPCVFPVLAVKITSLARADAQDRDEQARRERQRQKTSDNTSSLPSNRLQRALLANALGMVLAFLVLACVLVLVKSGGEKLGWGFQFHWPVFSGSLAALLLLLACDGWRILALPFPAYNEKIRHGEETRTRKQEWIGECATGMLLTWLATPCAAPVLGSALSAAIVQQPPVLFLMFAVMGAGMATPLLLAAIAPRKVARMLPAPGAWSERLRKVLATAIFVASFWLFSIFAKQLSLTAAGILAVATLLVVVALRKRQQAKEKGKPHSLLVPPLVRPLVLPVILASPVLVALLLDSLPRSATLQETASSPSEEAISSSAVSSFLGWQAFAPERIADFLVAENLVVVNVTADWCLSCKVIEQRVYKSAVVQERLEQLSVVLMHADWTSHDARIASFMRRHDRYAIPFTALFVPDGEVLLLPELYGKQTFLDALAYAETLRYQQAHNKASKP